MLAALAEGWAAAFVKAQAPELSLALSALACARCLELRAAAGACADVTDGTSGSLGGGAAAAAADEDESDRRLRELTGWDAEAEAEAEAGAAVGAGAKAAVDGTDGATVTRGGDGHNGPLSGEAVRARAVARLCDALRSEVAADSGGSGDGGTARAQGTQGPLLTQRALVIVRALTLIGAQVRAPRIELAPRTAPARVSRPR